METSLDAETDPQLRDRLLAHASECGCCRVFLEGVEIGLEPAAAERRRPSWKRPAWVAAAAGLLFAIGAGIVRNNPGAPEPAPAPRVLPAGEPVAVRGGEYAAGDDVRPFSLPDGSRLRLERGGRLLFVPPAPGERMHLRLLSGAVEAEIASGRGAFRVSAEAGRIEVLGTRFRAHAFRLRRLEGGEGTRETPWLCVEVHEGKVRLGSGASSLPVSAGERGLIAGGRSPEKQDLTTDRGFPLDLFAKLVREGPAGPEIPAESRVQAELLAAILVGSRWAVPSKSDGSAAERLLERLSAAGEGR